MSKLLEIKDLSVELMTTRGIVYALSGTDLSLESGEFHGVVGESGCGKSMTAKSIMGLHDPKKSRMKGSIVFDGKELIGLPEKEMEKMRGIDISMIFQDPMTSLNPLMRVGDQIADMVIRHKNVSKKEAAARAVELLSKVGMEPAEKRARQYPFELSGGMQQRVMIAMAIACDPRLLIADEPTTALDVTIQAQILELLKKLSLDMGMSVLLISHNFGVVAEVCDRVSVMYAGRVVETGDTATILKDPRHPYSNALIRSIPDKAEPGSLLETIPGGPPTLYAPPKGCVFAPRCPFASEECRNACPGSADLGNGHSVSCFHPVGEGGADHE